LAIIKFVTSPTSFVISFTVNPLVVSFCPPTPLVVSFCPPTPLVVSFCPPTPLKGGFYIKGKEEVKSVSEI